jgi:oligosaccharide repeat unit polymerase
VADLALAGALVCAAVVAFRRLAIFHPAALWLSAWAVAATLFASKALPYRSLSTTTLLVIATWSALFCAGTLLGPKLARLVAPPRWVPWLRDEPRSAAAAAALAAVIAIAGLGAFLAQVSSSYGIRAAIVSDAYVRLAISNGATPYTIKYIYAAFAASALAGLAAGRARSSSARRRWICVALLTIAMQYFSTGRSNLLLAALAACTAYFLSDPRTIDPRRVMLVAAVVAASTAAIFVGMGSLLNKGYGGSDIQTFDNAFVRHTALRPLALPYQYATAPIPAFDALVGVTPEFGRGGCRTLSPVCAIGRRLGLSMMPEPSLTGFTAGPSAWNTFTALYAPLVDGGPLLGALIIFAEGLLFGLLWAGARAGSMYGIVAYAVMSSALVYSTIENTLLQPHLVGAVLIALILTAATARVVPLRSVDGRQQA